MRMVCRCSSALPQQRQRQQQRRRPAETKLLIRWSRSSTSYPSSSVLLVAFVTTFIAILHCDETSSFLSSYHSCRYGLRYPSNNVIISNRLKGQNSNQNHAKRDNDDSNVDGNSSTQLIRLNKVFKKTHSRRQADKLILDGRVTVNGQVSYGTMVEPFADEVCLDGLPVQGWEEWNGLVRPPRDDDSNQDSDGTDNDTFAYIKYWKPRGVVCTTDRSIPGNILDELEYEDGCPVTNVYSRLYPVGRLDKDTTGLLLLTNDGRLPNSLLRSKYKQAKVYNVQTRYPISDEDLQRLRDGVVITTVAQRDGKMAEPLTAPTLPCRIERIGKEHKSLRSSSFRISIREGRNRQIRKMVEAVDNRVVRLHRTQFGGDYLEEDTDNDEKRNHGGGRCISLKNLRGPGDWQELEGPELDLVHQILRRAEQESAANTTTATSDRGG